jgi:hypothetical protein
MPLVTAAVYASHAQNESDALEPDLTALTHAHTLWHTAHSAHRHQSWGINLPCPKFTARLLSAVKVMKPHSVDFR